MTTQTRHDGWAQGEREESKGLTRTDEGAITNAMVVVKLL